MPRHIAVTVGQISAPDRSSLVVGVDKPSADNTGVLSGVGRSNYNAPGTSGTVAVAAGSYSNLDFYGDCYPSSATGTYTFSNCWFHGGIGHPASNRGTFYCWSLTTGWATFEDCTFSADDPSYYRDGLVGHRWTATRCQAFNVNDGFGRNASGGYTLEQCYVPWLTWWSQDPAHADGTHNDALQDQGGSGVSTVRGNNLNCYVMVAAGSVTTNTRPAPNGMYYGGSAIIVNQNIGAINSSSIYEKNWLAGGYAQLQLNAGTQDLTLNLGTNWYGRDVYDNYPANPDKRWVCLVPNGHTITDSAGKLYTEQRWEDDLTLLTAGRATGIRTV